MTPFDELDGCEDVLHERAQGDDEFAAQLRRLLNTEGSDES